MITSQNDIECFTRLTNLTTPEFASSTGLRVQPPSRGPSLFVLRLSKMPGDDKNYLRKSTCSPTNKLWETHARPLYLSFSMRIFLIMSQEDFWYAGLDSDTLATQAPHSPLPVSPLQSLVDSLPHLHLFRLHWRSNTTYYTSFDFFDDTSLSIIWHSVLSFPLMPNNQTSYPFNQTNSETFSSLPTYLPYLLVSIGV